jgi:FkbM family methyltransferase
MPGTANLPSSGQYRDDWQTGEGKMFIRAIFPPDDETRLVREFFGDAPGYFVDVGANDPQIGSQTWHLEQIGWTGVLVEPQPDLAARLSQQRKARVYAIACSSPGNSGKSMTLHLAGIQSSLDPHFFVFKMQREGAIDVPLKTLDEILIDAKAPAPLDFVSIDVESHEIEVLDGFDVACWRPRLLLIEDLVFNLRLHKYLQSRGYAWFRRTGINSWYVPADVAPAIGLFGRWQFVRKYYLGTPFRNLREMTRRMRSRFNESQTAPILNDPHQGRES